MYSTIVNAFFLCVVLYLIQSNTAIAQEDNLNEGASENTTAEKTLLDNDVFILDDKIVALVELSENDPERAASVYENLVAVREDLNLAEQYLMLIVRAYLEDKEGQEDQVISWLNQAIELEDKIAQTQLNTAVFNKIHAKLADIYVRTGNFKKAYEHKKLFTRNHFNDVRNYRENHIASLNEKYATDIKLKENELLQNQSEMRALRIKEIENEKQNQQRNLIVLLVTAVVFFLLLIRQINVRRKLKYLAKTDSLTGLFNRRTLFEKGHELNAECNESGRPISALLIDIDHFKRVNDTYGHDAGDKLIIAIANLGSEAMRSRDILARLGGEEFAAILPDSSLEEAKAIAERLREKVESHVLDYDGVALNVTISIGVANIRQVSPEFDNMLNAADEAMYEAKALGRNKVYCYQTEMEQT